MPKKRPKPDPLWAVADRISDQITDILNAELIVMREQGRIDPIQLFAGQCLALFAFERTMPRVKPPSLHGLFVALDLALLDIVQVVEKQKKEEKADERATPKP